MRAARWIAAAGAAATVAAVVTVTTGPATTAVKPPSPTWPQVPASAGTLKAGAVEYLWPKGHKEPRATNAAASAAAADPGNNMVYGGGATPGAISQTPGVYLVFWGAQWSKTDPVTTYLQKFFNGLYGAGDDWTTVSREFCEGVATGAISCPAGVPHVGGPNGPLLKGVWFDDALPAVPVTVGVLNVPSVDQMGAEATRAAAHFGNTTPASNTQSQYVVALPSGFLTPGEGYYCAYHSAVDSSYGSVAYTNLPYLNDVGAMCGQNFVNAGSAGTYDGYSLVEGHEYMETITDMRPRTGWADSGGQENADKCAWITSGQGAMANLTLSTGTFAVQSTWSNAFNGGAGGCVLHAG